MERQNILPEDSIGTATNQLSAEELELTQQERKAIDQGIPFLRK